MDQECRDAQRTNRFIRLLIAELHIIINEPLDRRIDRHIYLCIVQRSDTSQHNGRTIRLNSRTGIEIIDIFQEDTHRNLFIRIITGHIYTDQ